MPTKQPVCKTLFPWLRENLGKRCLGGLSGQDGKALCAAVQIVELWAYTSDPRTAAQAFGLCVRSMQESQRHLAFHAIAHVCEWSSRAQLWAEAGLSPIRYPLCDWEPGGRHRPLSVPQATA